MAIRGLKSSRDDLTWFGLAMGTPPLVRWAASISCVGTPSLLNFELEVQTSDLPQNVGTALQTPLLETQILIGLLPDQLEHKIFIFDFNHQAFDHRLRTSIDGNRQSEQ